MDINKDFIRAYMRDFDQYKDLNDNEQEWTDNEIEQAMLMSLSKFNMIPPMINLYESLEAIPNYYLAPVTYLIASELLKMRLFELSSNNIQYQSGGTGIDYNGIISAYAQLADKLEAEAKESINAIKLKENLNGVVGEISSPLRALSWW